jgi:hypothetical protein
VLFMATFAALAGAGLFIAGAVLQDRRSSTLSQYDRGFDLRKAAVIVSLSAPLAPTTCAAACARLCSSSPCRGCAPRPDPAASIDQGLCRRANPVHSCPQVYGAIMFVFDILVLFLCCRRGARKVSAPGVLGPARLRVPGQLHVHHAGPPTAHLALHTAACQPPLVEDATRSQHGSDVAPAVVQTMPGLLIIGALLSAKAGFQIYAIWHRVDRYYENKCVSLHDALLGTLLSAWRADTILLWACHRRACVSLTGWFGPFLRFFWPLFVLTELLVS